MSDEQEMAVSCLEQDQSGRPSSDIEEGPADPRFIPLSEEQAAEVLNSTDSTILPPEPSTALEEAPGTRQLEPPPITRVFQGRAASARARSGADIRAIVIHTPEGGVDATLGVLKGTRASFDFFLPLSGDLFRCNDYRRNIAFQAGDWPYNERGVGIEQGDFARNSGQFPDDHYRRLAYLVAYLIQTTNTPLRYAKNKGEDGIIDHRTITPNDRVDPGKNFKRDRLMELVKGYLNGTEPSPWASSGGTGGGGGSGITWVRGRFTAGTGAVARREHRRGDNIMRNLEAGKTYSTDGHTDAGENVNGSSRWYHLSESSGFGWVHASGGTFSEG